MTLNPAQQKLLLDVQGDFPMQPVRSLARTQVTKIIDVVRTTILEWALRLEGEGILGDGLTFTQEEKEKAAASTNIHIDTFQGILGNVSHSEVHQNLEMTVKRGDFDSPPSIPDRTGCR